MEMYTLFTIFCTLKSYSYMLLLSHGYIDIQTFMKRIKSFKMAMYIKSAVVYGYFLPIKIIQNLVQDVISVHYDLILTHSNNMFLLK